MPIRSIRMVIVTTAAALLLIACGGDGDDTPTSPSGGTGTTPVATSTITITASGVSPNSITISPGTRVTFVNNDSRNHDMASDPHPEHTTCPELNQVGLLAQGQSRTSGNLNTVRICSYHDHNDPTNRNLLGTVRIQ